MFLFLLIESTKGGKENNAVQLDKCGLHHLFLMISRLKRQNAIFLATKQSLSFTVKSKNPPKLQNSFRHSPRHLARGTRDLN